MKPHTLVRSALLLPLALITLASAEPSINEATAAEARSYRDYSPGRPWLPPLGDAITPAGQEVMRKLAGIPRYNPKPIVPNGTGTTAATLDDLEKRVADVLMLQVDPAAGVKGRAIEFIGEKGKSVADKSKPADFFTDFYPLFSEAAKAYQRSGKPNPGESPQSERAARLLCSLLVHFANQPLDGIRGPAKQGTWMGNGYQWRGADGGMGARLLSALPLLKDPATRANFLENLIWMQGGIGAQQSSSFSTDDYLNVVPQYLAAISAMQDSPAKWQRLLMARHAIETSIVAATDQATISPDGGVIHHGYAHNAYASYEFGPLCQLLRDLNDCGVPASRDSDEVAQRIARAGIAWATIHQPSRIVTNLEGRPTAPFVAERDKISKAGAADFALDAAATLASYQRPAYHEEIVQLLAVALAKDPAIKLPAGLESLRSEAARDHAALPPSLAYPVSGAILQRRDSWLVSVRGAPGPRRGGEGMPYGGWGVRHTFGGLYCKGSLMLVADGATPGAPPDLVSSGHAIDGRDMSLMPGVTAPILPWEKMVGSYFGSGATLAAPVALDGQGVWGFATAAVRKSCFLFDNRITYATALVDASSTDPKKKAAVSNSTLATTFIQYRHADGAEDTEYLDGKPMAQPAEWNLDDHQPHTLLATGGHGYYLHPTSEVLHLFRRTQENHLCEQPGSGTKFDKSMTPRPDAAVTFRGNFTTGYWTHDTTGNNAPVVFTLLVKSGKEGLDDFAQRMKQPATAPARISFSNNAHILYDAASRMWGAVFFAAGTPGPGHELNAACPLLAVDRPCSVALKPIGDGMTLAVSAGEELKPKPAPFTLTLKGHWRLAQGQPSDLATTHPAGAGDTMLVVAASAPAGRPVHLIPQ